MSWGEREATLKIMSRLWTDKNKGNADVGVVKINCRLLLS